MKWILPAVVGLGLVFGTAAAAGPEAQKISFWSDRAGFPGVWLMDADGRRPRLLTGKIWAKRGSWSPDGRRLVFDGPIGAGNSVSILHDFDLYVINSDGSGRRRLTRGPQRDVLAVWSPDGRTIAFTRSARRGAAEELWIVRPDGSGLRRLRRGAGSVWSPDGRQLAFAAVRGQRAVVQVLELANGRVRSLTGAGEDASPGDWSRDGSTLLITRYELGSGDIFALDLATGSEQRLTRGSADDFDPTWSPDGTRILFTSERGGNRDVYVMRADGTHVVRLTRNPAEDWATDWH